MYNMKFNSGVSTIKDSNYLIEFLTNNLFGTVKEDEWEKLIGVIMGKEIEDKDLYKLMVSENITNLKFNVQFSIDFHKEFLVVNFDEGFNTEIERFLGFVTKGNIIEIDTLNIPIEIETSLSQESYTKLVKDFFTYYVSNVTGKAVYSKEEKEDVYRFNFRELSIAIECFNDLFQDKELFSDTETTPGLIIVEEINDICNRIQFRHLKAGSKPYIDTTSIDHVFTTNDIEKTEIILESLLYGREYNNDLYVGDIYIILKLIALSFKLKDMFSREN